MYGVYHQLKLDSKITAQRLNRCQKSHTVKCSLCCKVISFNEEDKGRLVKHLQKKHPDVQMAWFLSFEEEEIEDRSKVYSKSNDKKVPTKKKGVKDKYEATVELWKSASTASVCENCGAYTTPIIKHKKNTVTDSKTAALFLLGCWPFCYLPYMMGKDSSNDTYSCCSKCNYVFPMKS
ncbi:hypothetical protein J437_LFUL016587 [Ladona fulva]|uniref:LITAF domain-containing protein n=1 Tax=Ladona fulva TaxID=123851 RepID=A0A8K0JXI1_LADFU|nr:hypothetical protein J437_LFUL016587 [Ladona fulva]